jgi:F420-dependent oxidoreductase-like protein
MDLCLMIEGQEGVTWPQWVALARACEEHGVPALFRSDHYLELGGEHPERGSLDAWTTLAALGAVTTTLRLGTLVSPATFRHPSVLAKAVVTADHVSDGRVELGLGAGWHEREHAAYGFPFPPTRERVDVLEEQLQVILGSWSDGPFTFDAEHYGLRDLDARPKPVQRPHPPICVGGNGERRTLRTAARFAQHWNFLGGTPEEFARKRDVLHEHCADIGRDPKEIVLSSHVRLDPSGDPASAVEAAAALGKEGLDLAIVMLPPPHDPGVLAPLAEALAQLA